MELTPDGTREAERPKSLIIQRFLSFGNRTQKDFDEHNVISVCQTTYSKNECECIHFNFIEKNVSETILAKCECVDFNFIDMAKTFQNELEIRTTG